MTPMVAPNANSAAKLVSNCDQRDRAPEAAPPPPPPDPGRREEADGDSEDEDSGLLSPPMLCPPSF